MILPQPKVLIEVTNLSLMGLTRSTNKFDFGVVRKQYATSGFDRVGDTVIYNNEGAIDLSEGTTNYVIVNENEIFSQEVLPP